MLPDQEMLCDRGIWLRSSTDDFRNKGITLYEWAIQMAKQRHPKISCKLKMLKVWNSVTKRDFVSEWNLR